MLMCGAIHSVLHTSYGVVLKQGTSFPSPLLSFVEIDGGLWVHQALFLFGMVVIEDK
jgi:hypothetical protein